MPSLHYAIPHRTALGPCAAVFGIYWLDTPKRIICIHIHTFFGMGELLSQSVRLVRLSMFAAALCLGVFSAIPAEAVSISNVTHDGFAIQWEPTHDSYIMAIYELPEFECCSWALLDILAVSFGNYTGNVELESAVLGAYAVAGLEESTTYRYDIIPTVGNIAMSGNVTKSGNITTHVMPRPLGEFGEVRVDDTKYSSAAISWEPVEHATSYSIFLRDALHGNTTDTAYEFAKLYSGTTYEFAIHATNGTGTVYGSGEFHTDRIPIVALFLASQPHVSTPPSWPESWPVSQPSS